ncbi:MULTISPECIES: hypothetical protein [Lysobacter]|jgi:hypothetical protein|uniref:hypothetical protein n=1 Tax=Lysobacteraceae TaxID=32033 RepID=UPI001CD04A2F|nr:MULTISPECIES: hypothetical protein [Lysobacter]
MHASVRTSGHQNRLPRQLLSWLLLVLGVCGFAAVWVMLALYTGRQCSVMAILGALDVAIILRLGSWRPGPGRVTLAVLATTAIIILANWTIIAAQLGAMLGLSPWDSALRLGSHHAWTLATLANGTGDLAWLAAAWLVAAISTR